MYQPEFACRGNGIPLLSNDMIERDAENFLKDFDPVCLDCPVDVDIDAFAEFYLGLTPGFFRLTSYGGILGMMIFHDKDKVPIYLPEEKRADYYYAGRGEVLIDASLENDEHRLRSTMAHEAGHWIYHQAYFPRGGESGKEPERRTCACRKPDIAGSGPKRLISDEDWLEHQANYFSAAILMPRRAMRNFCRDPFIRSILYKYDPDKALTELSCMVSETFNVSEESAKIRIGQLNLTPVKEPDAYKRDLLADTSEYVLI